MNILSMLSSLLETDQSVQVRIKALFAVSSRYSQTSTVVAFGQNCIAILLRGS